MLTYTCHFAFEVYGFIATRVVILFELEQVLKGSWTK